MPRVGENSQSLFRWDADRVTADRLIATDVRVRANEERAVLRSDGPSSIACTPGGQVVWCTEDPEGEPEYKKLLDAPAGLKGVQIGEADKGAHSYTFWHYAPHEGWKTFNLPAVAVFGSSGIAQFAEKGVTVHQPLMFFSALREAVDTYKRVKAMEIKYDQFGWKDGETKFLCGDRMYSAGSEMFETVSVSKVAEGRVKYLGPVALDPWREWRSAATTFFKPGFEAQALTLVAGFASPLMCFIDRSEGGIFLHLFSAASGAGKSLGLMASCSIYGLEKGLRLIKGDTPVAKAIAMGVLCNLPIIYDEIMDQDPEAIRKQVDVFRDGRDRSPEEQLMEQSDRYKVLGLLFKSQQVTVPFSTCCPRTGLTPPCFECSRLNRSCRLVPTPLTAIGSASNSSTTPGTQATSTSDT